MGMNDTIIKMMEEGDVPDIKAALGLLKKEQKKQKVEKRPPLIKGEGSDVSSLFGKDTIVSKEEVTLEEFDSFPFVGVDDGNLLEINPQMKSENKFK